MRLVFGVMAEYVATLSPDNRWMIAGIFDGFGVNVQSEHMPAQVPPHWLLIRTAFSTNETGDFESALRLRDEDGRELATFGPFRQRVNPGRLEGLEVFHNWASQFHDLTVPRCGTYLWEVLINGQMIGEIPFHVTRGIPPAPHQVLGSRTGG